MLKGSCLDQAGNQDSAGQRNMDLFAVIDLKTTGLTAAREERVVEIAVVILNEKYQVVRIFDSLVNPQWLFPRDADPIHGIPVQAMQSAPTFAQLLPELMECLAGSTHLVAHNVDFVGWNLQAELWHLGIPMPPVLQTVSTMQLAVDRQVSCDGTLLGVASALGIPTFSHHDRAIVAAGMTARALRILQKENTAAAYNPIPWPRFQKSSDFTRQLPRGSRPVSVHDMSRFRLGISRQNRQPKRSPRKLTAQEWVARRYPPPNSYGITRLHDGMNNSATWSWHLFTQAKLSVSAIADLRCLTESTIYTHLERALRCGLVTIQEVASESEIASISSAWYALRDENRYMRLFAVMHSDIRYGLLKCVITSLDAACQQHTELPAFAVPWMEACSIATS